MRVFGFFAFSCLVSCAPTFHAWSVPQSVIKPEEVRKIQVGLDVGKVDPQKFSAQFRPKMEVSDADVNETYTSLRTKIEQVMRNNGYDVEFVSYDSLLKSKNSDPSICHAFVDCDIGYFQLVVSKEAMGSNLVWVRSAPNVPAIDLRIRIERASDGVHYYSASALQHANFVTNAMNYEIKEESRQLLDRVLKLTMKDLPERKK